MSKQTINLGTLPNDGLDGDDARTAFTKVNQNFSEVYSALGGDAGTVSPKLTAIAKMVWPANAVLLTTGPDSIAPQATGVKGRELMAVATDTAARAAIGLNNVNNTSDANKPVSTATQVALDAKQPLNAKLTAIAASVWTVNQVMVATGANSLAMVNVTPGDFFGAVGAIARIGDHGFGAVRSGDATLPDGYNRLPATPGNTSATCIVAANGTEDLATSHAPQAGVEFAGLHMSRSLRPVQVGVSSRGVNASLWFRGFSGASSAAADWLQAVDTRSVQGLGFDVTAAVSITLTALDANRKAGFFQITSADSATTGLPLAAGHVVQHIPGSSSASGHKQIAYPATSVTGNYRRTWIRSMWSGVWSVWEEQVLLSTPLTGFAVGSNTPVTSTDTLMAALGKLQGQINGLGTAAKATLVTSATDNTANRVMVTGSFGVGRHLDLRGNIMVNGTPADCYGKGTVYGMVNGGTGDANSLAVPGLAGVVYGVLTIHGQYQDESALGAIMREFVTGAPGGPRKFIQRAVSATAWGLWVEEFNTYNAVGPMNTSVHQSAIVERGGNSNGEYTRFIDGTMMCWNTMNTEQAPTSGTSDLIWTFPVPFANAGYSASAVATPLLSWDMAGIIAIHGKSAWSVGARFRNGASGPQIANVSLMAIGRWK